MAKQNDPHLKATKSSPPPLDPPVPPEPEMRRWRHPVEASGMSAPASPHYIHCALGYQSQLLAEIKTLLEQIALDVASKEGEK